MFYFFFNDSATTDIYTLSLHDALPIYRVAEMRVRDERVQASFVGFEHLLSAVGRERAGDRKSTRLNSSHQIISYAVFCLKKKKHRSRELTDLQTMLRERASCKH